MGEMSMLLRFWIWLTLKLGLAEMVPMDGGVDASSVSPTKPQER
jgi:hypothetical protein